MTSQGKSKKKSEGDCKNKHEQNDEEIDKRKSNKSRMSAFGKESNLVNTVSIE